MLWALLEKDEGLGAGRLGAGGAACCHDGVAGEWDRQGEEHQCVKVWLASLLGGK